MKLPWTKKKPPPPVRRQPEPLNPAALKQRRDRLRDEVKTLTEHLDMLMLALPDTASAMVIVSRKLTDAQQALHEARP